jgi:hypothetical protein
MKHQVIGPGKPVAIAILISITLTAAFLLSACGSDDGSDSSSKQRVRYGEGQENLETRSLQAVVEADSGPMREQEIGSQLDADALITIGMAPTEITDMIRPNPAPPWLSIGLRDSEAGDQITLDVTSNDGTSYSFTSEPKDGTILSADTSATSAFIFFSSIQPKAKTSFIFVGEDGRVFMMAKVQCPQTLAIVAAGKQHDRVPRRSACTD